MLIVNADDWGRDGETTRRILDCVLMGTVSSVSAMVFMEDSAAAAAAAQENHVDAGLHINLTEPFTARSCPSRAAEHQGRIAAYLKKHKLAQVVFHPGLTRPFQYVVAAQMEEFQRLYGAPLARIDGHHHMHLAANVVFAGLLPAGTVVRRNFYFEPGEKGVVNRYYRKAIDGILTKRHRLVDYLFNLAPMDPASRIDRIFSFAKEFIVELEVHPAIPREYTFLTQGGILARLGSVRVANGFRFAFDSPGERSFGCQLH